MITIYVTVGIFSFSFHLKLSKQIHEEKKENIDNNIMGHGRRRLGKKSKKKKCKSVCVRKGHDESEQRRHKNNRGRPRKATESQHSMMYPNVAAQKKQQQCLHAANKVPQGITIDDLQVYKKKHRKDRGF
jgi:hypothetical protein